jgi:hypothetical protein
MKTPNNRAYPALTIDFTFELARNRLDISIHNLRIVFGSRVQLLFNGADFGQVPSRVACIAAIISARPAPRLFDYLSSGWSGPHAVIQRSVSVGPFDKASWQPPPASEFLRANFYLVSY